MIRLSSIYPFSNFLRITQEFCEDHARVKMRSLVSEREYEFKYEEVMKISFENHANNSQTSFGFGLLTILMIIFAFSLTEIPINPLPFWVIQVLFVLSTVLFLTGFIKNRYFYFLDINNRILTFIKVTHENYESITKVIELVKTRSKYLQENAFDNPFPSSKPVFELVGYDVPNYLNKSVTRFYEDELIEFDVSIFGESVSSYEYNRMSGNVYRGKQGNESWDSVFWFILVLSGISAGSYSAFNIPSRGTFLATMAVLAILLVISFLLRYIKQEILGLYDKNNRIIYWTWIHRGNKERIEKVIEYVISRIPVENKLQQNEDLS